MKKLASAIALATAVLAAPSLVLAGDAKAADAPKGDKKDKKADKKSDKKPAKKEESSGGGW